MHGVLQCPRPEGLNSLCVRELAEAPRLWDLGRSSGMATGPAGVAAGRLRGQRAGEVKAFKPFKPSAAPGSGRNLEVL